MTIIIAAYTRGSLVCSLAPPRGLWDDVNLELMAKGCRGVGMREYLLTCIPPWDIKPSFHSLPLKGTALKQGWHRRQKCLLQTSMRW